MKNYHLDDLRRATALDPTFNNQATLINALEIELIRVTRERDALSYPVALHTNPLLTVEAGGIRYVLEVMSDEDGEWFEVKSATPTEALTLADFAGTDEAWDGDIKAREALTQYRAEQQRNDEAERAE